MCSTPKRPRRREPPFQPTRMSQSRTSPRTAASVLRPAAIAVACSIALATTAKAQELSGDYVLKVDGQAILSLMLRQDASGRLTGTVSAAGKELPLSGMIRGGGGVFVSSAPDGSRLHWQAVAQDGALAVVMAPAGLDGQPDPALAQRHVLVRGQPGGGLARGSQRWIARLAAAADSIVSWCSSPMYAESDLCVNALQVLRKVAPALMVARFATSGQAGSLMRVLAQDPGASGRAPGPPITHSDDSFLSAIDPPSGDFGTGPPPDDFAEPPPVAAPEQPGLPQSSEFPSLAQSLLGAGGTTAPAPSSASEVTGDWVMLHAGSEVLRVRLVDAGAGAVSGTLALMGTPFPFSGTAGGDRVSFTTRSAGGIVGQWQGTVSGDQLSLSLTTSSGTERYELRRQGAGWSDAVPLARQWDAALRGRVVAHSAGARDPATGAAVETLLHFCGDGVLRMEVAGTPGAAMPAWRVVATADQAAIELSAPEGIIQVGLGAGTAEGITFAGHPARIVGASAACR
jgi:hypothetical protein